MISTTQIKEAYAWICNWLDPNVVGLVFSQQSTLDRCWCKQTKTDYPKSKTHSSPEMEEVNHKYLVVHEFRNRTLLRENLRLAKPVQPRIMLTLFLKNSIIGYQPQE